MVLEPTWYTAPPVKWWGLLGEQVHKPYVFSYYQMCSYLRPLNTLREGQPLSGDAPTIRLITMAKIGLLLFLVPDNKRFFSGAYSKAEMLSKYIDELVLILPGGEPWDNFLPDAKVQAMKDMLKSFETLLQHELDGSPIYICDEEILGNLSIEKLLAGAHKGYPIGTRALLPSRCAEEIDEAGRCLVFERPTAAGFHVLRGVEIATKYYLSKVPGFVMPPLNRQNWGEYISLLKGNGAAAVVTDTLQGIKSNHRNPLMHPEDTLSLAQAVSLFAVCQSMMEGLMVDLTTRGLI